MLVFERFEKEYGTLDDYINNHDPEEVIIAFSDYESEYKLKMMHVSLVCEYLRNVGGTFDWKDILCYGVGCGILMVIEIFKKKRRTKNWKK